MRLLSQDSMMVPKRLTKILTAATMATALPPLLFPFLRSRRGESLARGVLFWLFSVHHFSNCPPHLFSCLPSASNVSLSMRVSLLRTLRA